MSSVISADKTNVKTCFFKYDTDSEIVKQFSEKNQSYYENSIVKAIRHYT